MAHYNPFAANMSATEGSLNNLRWGTAYRPHTYKSPISDYLDINMVSESLPPIA